MAEGTITPPLGVRLSGYGGRDQPADAIHDELRCQALVLEHGHVRVALLTCDLVGLSVPLAHAWRAELAARVGMPAAHVLLSCSHTHAGPPTRMLGETPTSREAAYLEYLRNCLIGTAETAAARLTPARLRLAQGRFRSQRNRRDRLPGEHGSLDDGLGVLCVEDAAAAGDRPALAVVAHYACHPVALRANNLGVSADYVSGLRTAVRTRTGATPLFLQGAAGDLIPDAAPRSLDDRTKGFPTEVHDQLRFAQAFGARIGDEVVRLVGGAERIALDGAGAASATLGGVARTFPAEFQVTDEPADAAEWAAGQPTAFEVQTLRVGRLAIVGLPVEPLNALGLALRSLALRGSARSGPALRGQPPTGDTDSGPVAVWCAGYANGCYGYLPVREEYLRGGYEVASAHRYYGRPGPFTPDTAERVVAEAAKGIATLWPSGPLALWPSGPHASREAAHAEGGSPPRV